MAHFPGDFPNLIYNISIGGVVFGVLGFATLWAVEPFIIFNALQELR